MVRDALRALLVQCRAEYGDARWLKVALRERVCVTDCVVCMSLLGTDTYTTHPHVAHAAHQCGAVRFRAVPCDAVRCCEVCSPMSIPSHTFLPDLETW